MKFDAILVKPLSDQTDRDGHKIDPAGVSFVPGEEVPIWRDFSFNVPDDLMGHGRLSRAKDGTIVVTGELNDNGKSFVDRGVAKLAIGIRVDRQELEKHRGAIVRESSLMTIGMTWNHQDPAQPAIRILDQL